MKDLVILIFYNSTDMYKLTKAQEFGVATISEDEMRGMV
jgi:hypothetical protein